jgi:hypothetical protein
MTSKLERTPSVSSQELNWKPPPRDHPVLRRMQSFSMQSYKPKIISENRRMLEDLCRDLVRQTFYFCKFNFFCFSSNLFKSALNFNQPL